MGWKERGGGGGSGVAEGVGDGDRRGELGREERQGEGGGS